MEGGEEEEEEEKKVKERENEKKIKEKGEKSTFHHHTRPRSASESHAHVSSHHQREYSKYNNNNNNKSLSRVPSPTFNSHKSLTQHDKQHHNKFKGKMSVTPPPARSSPSYDHVLDDESSVMEKNNRLLNKPNHGSRHHSHSRVLMKRPSFSVSSLDDSMTSSELERNYSYNNRDGLNETFDSSVIPQPTGSSTPLVKHGKQQGGVEKKRMSKEDNGGGNVLSTPVRKQRSVGEEVAFEEEEDGKEDKKRIKDIGRRNGGKKSGKEEGKRENVHQKHETDGTKIKSASDEARASFKLKMRELMEMQQKENNIGKSNIKKHKKNVINNNGVNNEKLNSLLNESEVELENVEENKKN
jgi:hypothetical protein